MGNRLLITVFLSSVFVFVSCSDDDDKNPVAPTTVTGSGTLTTVERDVNNFHSVSFSTVGSVYITSGAQQSVSITVDDNIAAYILTTVSNGVLFVSSNPTVGLSDFDLTVNITMIDLEGLTLSGVGTIVGVSQFEVDSLYLWLSGVGNIILHLRADYISSSITGVGNIHLTGAVDRHNCLHSAVGTIQAFELISDTTVARLSGIGNAEVYVSDSLDVTISGSGSLYYRGDPTITQIVTGTGRVIDAN